MRKSTVENTPVGGNGDQLRTNGTIKVSVSISF